MVSTAAPAATTAMLIRRPVEDVFEAFVDPAITSKFWFSSGSARLTPGAKIRWEWKMFNVSDEVLVKVVEPQRRIVIEWPGHGSTNTVEWRFEPKGEGRTFVNISETGFAADDEQLVAKVADSTGGFALVLAGCKAWLEHGIVLNLVIDRFPDGPPGG